MALSTYLANKLLDHSLGKTSFTMPTPYFSLHTASPGAGGAGNTNETAVAGYARAAVGTLMAAASAQASANSTLVGFGTAGAGATITHIGVSDASSGASNLLHHGPLTTSRTFANGDPMQFPIGQLSFGIT